MRFAILSASMWLVLFAVQLAANPIPATPWGDIDLYADPNGLNEEVWDQTPGLMQVYVVQISGPPGGAAAVQFRAPRPVCFNALWLSDTCPFSVVIGNSQTGVGIGYGACRPYPVHALTMNFFAQGTTPPCCYYWVRPDPQLLSGEIEGSDCNFEVVYLRGGATIINRPDAGCPTATEPTTWGRVKSLYAD